MGREQGHAIQKFIGLDAKTFCCICNRFLCSTSNLNPNIRFLFHGHVPAIWSRAEALGLPTTAASVEYGTQAMAFETARLYRSTNLSESKCYTMGGHEDGVVTFGRTASEAGEILVRILARAYALHL